jgi:hypothetical protein
MRVFLCLHQSPVTKSALITTVGSDATYRKCRRKLGTLYDRRFNTFRSISSLMINNSNMTVIKQKHPLLKKKLSLQVQLV